MRLAPLLVVVAQVACASDPATGGAPPLSAGGVAGASGAAGASGSGGAAACTPGPGETCVRELRGRVVDTSGAPVAGVFASVCGAVCYAPPPGEVTPADGTFAFPVGAPLSPSEFSTLVHGRPVWAGFYLPLPATLTATLDLGELPVVALPPSGPRLAVKGDGAPAQRAVSGELTLIVPAGTELRLDVEDAALGAAGQELKVARVPAAALGRFVPAELGAVAAWAISPFEATLRVVATGEPGLAQVELENVTALPAGTRVELLALGSYLFPEWVPPATWASVAAGAVSADGARVELDPGQGLRHLTAVAVKVSP
ncbi:MAG: hypothetical protein IT376_14145 [Polyangiaceae bacterium]|nr:hypothetical protein [Polyangiaceae bacterium]